MIRYINRRTSIISFCRYSSHKYILAHTRSKLYSIIIISFYIYWIYVSILFSDASTQNASNKKRRGTFRRRINTSFESYASSEIVKYRYHLLLKQICTKILYLVCQFTHLWSSSIRNLPLILHHASTSILNSIFKFTVLNYMFYI